jgi:putative ABC transport system ATP-binding protein
MITLESVQKWYNRGAPNEVHALKDISLLIQENEAVCIQGPSGSGKSTLLSIVGCLFAPTSGTAIIHGKPLSRLPDRFLTLYRRETIGFIFQRFHLIPGLSVIANITIPLLPLGVSVYERRHRAEQLMERLSLSHRKDFDIAHISGGELQRAAIARALINEPPIIVADEPTAHLDEQLSNDFMSIIAELKADGKTILIASHDPLVGKHTAIDRCLSMRDGRLTVPER